MLVALQSLSTGWDMIPPGQKLYCGSSRFMKRVILIQQLPLLGCCVLSAIAIAHTSEIGRAHGQKKHVRTYTRMCWRDTRSQQYTRGGNGARESPIVITEYGRLSVSKSFYSEEHLLELSRWCTGWQTRRLPIQRSMLR